MAAAPTTARAQASDDTQESVASRSWTTRFGPNVARRWLRSGRFEDRLRAVRRIGSQNDYTSVQILVQALTDDPALASSPQIRLESVRALAPFVSRDPVRILLTGWMTPPNNQLANPLINLAADQASMALAASGNTRAIEQLVMALAENDQPRAVQALRAHPPANLEPLLQARFRESTQVIDLIGHLGDLRAIPALRKLLHNADLNVQVAAAIALARLGDASGCGKAKDWIRQEGSTHALRVGATQTLVLCRDPWAPRAMAILLADPATRQQGLDLVEIAPTAQCSPTLAGLLTIAEDRERVRVIAALARCGGPLAARTLESLLRDGNTDAAFALAQCRGPEASQALSRALADPKTKRLAAWAGVLRYTEMAIIAEGLGDALTSLASSHAPADRFIGVFGLVLLGDVQRIEAAQDPVAVVAACNAASTLSADKREPCIEKLKGTRDPAMRDGLAGCLHDIDSIDGLSTATLFEWAESERISAPVFGRLLGVRDSESSRKRIERLLASSDPDMRAQVALGLAHSPQPSALSLLGEALTWETEPMVRRAIVTALQRRQSTLGQKWLNQAAHLDPDPIVRSLARPHPFARPITQQQQWFWLRLGESQATQTASHAVRVMLPHGSASVIITAEDGMALVPGVTYAETRLRVDGVPWQFTSSRTQEGQR